MRPSSILCAIAAFLVAESASADVIQSTQYPLRVHFTDPGESDLATMLLAAAESSWSFQVDGLGMLPPPADDGLGGSDDYDIFIETTSDLAKCSFTGPASDRPAGGTTRLVFDPSVPHYAVPLLVSHEFHHALQAGICGDMGNDLAESGAIYISGMERRGEGWILSYYLGFNAFQARPDRAVDWQGSLGDFYPYGSALFLFFVEQSFGDYDNAKVYVNLWKDLLADSEVSQHCASHLTVLKNQIDVDEAYRQFSRWRYFLGPNDDGNHFADLDNWQAQKLDSVAIDREVDAFELPVETANPVKAPMPYGATFVRLSLSGLAPADSVKVSFQGDDSVRWSLQRVLLSPQETAEESGIEADELGSAEYEFSVGTHTSAVLAFVNLGDGTYDGTSVEFVPSAFTYSLSRIETLPDAGAQEAGWDAGIPDAEPDAIMTDGPAEASTEDWDVGTADAEPDAIMTDGPAEVTPAPTEDEGCSCKAAGRSGGSWSASVFGVLALLFARCRRRQIEAANKDGDPRRVVLT